MGSQTAFRFWRFSTPHRRLKLIAILIATQLITRLSAQSPLIKQFQDTKWDAAYDAWRTGHPAAKCRAFDGTGFGADEEWCYRCDESAGVENYEWSFYAFDVAAPVCR